MQGPGYCECGCGERTIVSPVTDRWHGWTKGEPRRFIAGHNNRLRRVGFKAEDRGYTTPCHIYQGSLNHAGYGRVFGGQAHRVAWERVHGPIPEGLEPDHLCRVRACINVEHLELVTRAENCRRGAAARPGVAQGGIAAAIRDARRDARWSQRELAERLGVTAALIGHYERGHCDPPASRIAQLERVLRRELAEGMGDAPEPAFTAPIGGRQ